MKTTVASAIKKNCISFCNVTIKPYQQQQNLRISVANKTNIVTFKCLLACKSAKVRLIWTKLNWTSLHLVSGLVQVFSMTFPKLGWRDNMILPWNMLFFCQNTESKSYRRLVITSHLLTCYRSKQVIWPSPISKEQENILWLVRSKKLRGKGGKYIVL